MQTKRTGRTFFDQLLFYSRQIWWTRDLDLSAALIAKRVIIERKRERIVARNRHRKQCKSLPNIRYGNLYLLSSIFRFYSPFSRVFFGNLFWKKHQSIIDY